ncbi:MAG: thioredoxin family protein [Candidatus Bathyarchaeia archaeon]
MIAAKVGKNIFDYINEIRNSKIKQTMKKRVQEYSLKTDLIDKFEKIDEKHSLIAFSAEWNPECQAQIPILAKLLIVTKNNNLVVKVIELDENRDIAEEFGVTQVPTIIVYDKRWNELGRFVEKPKNYSTLEEELWSIFEKKYKN